MRRGYVDSPDGQIHYREAGEGEPVIILHPTPMSSRALIPLIEATAAQGFRAIGMDTMGYGESDRPKKPYTTMGEFAQSVVWLMDGLGIDKANLLAGLTGSQIALQVAADFPDRVKSVVTQEAFNWGTESRRGVHERLHRYHPRTEEGAHIQELYERSAWGGPKGSREQDLNLRDFIYVNDDEGAEVYEGMGWEGAGPYSMCRTVMWDITPKITAPVNITYTSRSELHRSLEKFMETLPRGKGDRNVPSFLGEPEGYAKHAAEFFRNPGV